MAIGADVATVSTATYDSVVSGWDPATVDSVGVVAASAASESLPAHTPAAITAASTAPAAPTGDPTRRMVLGIAARPERA